jgi:hypothetical protein
MLKNRVFEIDTQRTLEKILFYLAECTPYIG